MPLTPIKMRADVVALLRETLPGKNLYEVADQLGVTVRKEGNLNKGWAGQTIELAAGLKIDNLQSRDGFDFELKSTSLKKISEGWDPKETIKITTLNPSAILEEEFETSALWNKMERLILVGCYHESKEVCRVVTVNTIDIDSPELMKEIRNFWDDIRHTICAGEMPDYPYLGRSDDYLQLRPTGTGKLSSLCPVTNRKFPAQAFYATKRLIRQVLP